MGPLQEALVFLISTFLQLYFVIVLLHFLFQYFHIGFNNPFSQFVFKATNPILIPFRKAVPKFKNFDLAALLLLITLKAIELSAVTLLTKGFMPNLMSLVIWPMGELFSQIINLFFFATLIAILLSWFNPSAHTPFTIILTQITEPLLSPIRRWIPITIGIDLSPMFVLIGLKTMDILLARPMILLGNQLAFLS